VYGLNSTEFFAQSGAGDYFNNRFITGSSHLNYLEDFSPFRTGDPFRWIPNGLFYDLVDDRNDRGFDPTAIIDAVSGYTSQQFFNALETDITSLPAYKQRLLQQNNNAQAPQVIQLFGQYNF
jgi:hypothetical protein